MPLYTDLPSFGYYYNGNVSPYANHSSLGGSYSRTPYPLSSYTSYSRGYSPLLSTISESRVGTASRINSPKNLHLHTSPKYRAPKPIRINTADIDVSANKYRRERPAVSTTTPESHIVYGVSPTKYNAQDGPFMPRAEPHEDDVSCRSTIKRGRTVVRLSTIRARNSGTPDREPGKPNWRRDLAEDLNFKDGKKVRKTPGEKLIEKHLIRDKGAINTISPEQEVVEEIQQRGRAPSFHDICRDISSDKLYDDLNAGELRKIAERRKSEDMFSPLIEVPSETVDVFNEDGTFHRRTTLKKIRKSKKAVFVRIPDTPHPAAEIAAIVADTTEIPQIKPKSPKITASVEVQNSENALRVLSTEVEVETKCIKPKRKLFYKIVVEDVIETKPNEPIISENQSNEEVTQKDLEKNEEKHSGQPLCREKSRVSIKEKSPLLMKDKSPVPIKEKSPVLIKEKSPVPIKDKSPLLIKEKSPVPIKEKIPVPRKETMTKSPVVASMDTTRKSNLITDKAQNKSKSSKTDTQACESKQVEDSGDNFWEVIGSRESVYYSARRQRILTEQRQRFATHEPLPEAPVEDSSADQIKPKEELKNNELVQNKQSKMEIENDPSSRKKNEQPVKIESKLLNKSSEVKPAAPIASKTAVENKLPDKILQSQVDKSVVKPINVTPVPKSNDKLKSVINNKSQESIIKPDNESILSKVLKTSPAEVTTESKTILKNIKNIDFTEDKVVITQSTPNNTSADGKLTDISTKKAVYPKLTKLSVSDNDIKKTSNLDHKNISNDPSNKPKVPETNLESSAAISKVRNKKYVKAKTLDLRNQEEKDVTTTLRVSTSNKKQVASDINQSSKLKKQNSETDIPKKSELSTSDTKLSTINKDTQSKVKQTKYLVQPKLIETSQVLETSENTSSKHQLTINDGSTIAHEKLIESAIENKLKPTIATNISSNLCEKKSPENSLNNSSTINAANIKPVKKQIIKTDIPKPSESTLSISNTKLDKINIDTVTKINQPKCLVQPKSIDKSHVLETPEIISTKQKPLLNDSTAITQEKQVKPIIDNKLKSTIPANISSKVSENKKVPENSNKENTNNKPVEKPLGGNEVVLNSTDTTQKTDLNTATHIIKNKLGNQESATKNIESSHASIKRTESTISKQEILDTPLDKKSEEQLKSELDTPASTEEKYLVPKKSKKSSFMNRQSLKSFTERVTERVKNPSLRLLFKSDELKPAQALISMNTSSDLTANLKDPIKPAEKKIKLVPKNEPAPKPLVATPRPLQAVVRNRKAQQLQHSLTTSEESSDSSWTDSSDEESDEAEFFECSSPIGNQEASTDSLITTDPSFTYEQFMKTQRIIPPATKIPRFRKYCLEDFNFLKVLGKGSFGKVLLAELRNTEFYYAVKCLNKNVVLEDDDVECTLIERKVLALGTKHPYLCHLFCTFQTESHLFFVMEYLNGGDLMFHIQHSGRFTEPRASFYAAEIVSGLRFLHKKGIVYRDLKLDNILLDFDGHVRIADFGMCKLQIYLDKTADTFCGTPDYMAPEIIKGLRYNQSVDWWSFGVLLYEMLIGQSPFSGCDEDELFWSICNEIPYYPRHLSSEALEILTRFLNKDSEGRLGSGTCPFGDVTDQRFFQCIDWDRLERRQLEAPFKPRVMHPLDTQYFDKAFTGEIARLTPIDDEIMRDMNQERFRGFSYTNPNATD